MYLTIVRHALIVVFANTANNDAVVFSVLMLGSGGVGWGGAITFFIDIFIDLHSNLTLRYKIFSCTCTAT